LNKDYVIDQGDGGYEISEQLLDIEDAQFEKNYYTNRLVYMISIALCFVFIYSLKNCYDVLSGRNFLADAGEAGQDNPNLATPQDVGPNEEAL